MGTAGPGVTNCVTGMANALLARAPVLLIGSAPTALERLLEQLEDGLLAAPSLLIGHSLGGAAVLAAAARIPEAKAIATIAAPSDERKTA